MKRSRHAITSVNIVSLTLAVVLMSLGCKEGGNVGSEIIDDDPVEIFPIDTLTIRSSTVFMDSVDTQDSGLILTGSYTDDYLGWVSANGYITFSLNGTFTVSQNARYDSLSLRLTTSYYHGDATRPQQIQVHRVTETIEPEDNNTRLYNFDKFDYDQELLGKTMFTPDEQEELSIPVSDLLGQALFEAAQRGADVATDDETFREYLKGFVLTGDHIDNTAVTGFEADSTDDIVLRLYYTDLEDGVASQQQHDFLLKSTSSFSHISGKYPTPLDQLGDPLKSISSMDTGNRTFLQNGVGLMTRLDFPTADRLFDISQNIVLNSAELYIFPVAHTYNPETPLPELLVLHVADNQNRIIGAYTDSEGNVLAAQPIVDGEFNRKTHYRFDITDYIQSELDTEHFTGRGLLLSTSSQQYRQSVNRLVLGDSDNTEFKMYLQIIATKINY